MARAFWAQAWPRASGAKQDGFHPRFHFGLGANSVEADSDPKVKINGTGGAFGISIGGIVAENLGVFAEVSNSVPGTATPLSRLRMAQTS